MAHDVFISHSTRDKPVADAVCAALENAGIRCWVAPRDVQPGRSFAGEITRAIQQSRAMVLIFSAHSNKSSQVLREVQLAVDAQLHILQFRIEEVLLNDDLKYYLSTPHWLDAMTPPLENHLQRLASSITVLLGKSPPTPVPSPSEKQGENVAVVRVEPALPVLPPAAVGSPRRNPWLLAFAVLAALCGIGLGVILFRDRVLTKRLAAPEPSPASVAATPAQPVTASVSPAQDFPILSPRKTKLFSHNFETRSTIVRPLFGANVMSIQNANGEGQITSRSPGILPAMFDDLLLDDFIVECMMRAEVVPTGARYGFIFRAADVRNGGISRYYALLLDPNQETASMSWWMDGKWMMNPEQPVPAGLLNPGQKSWITLEAIGSQFRIFINDLFATEFSMEGLTKGRIGLCLSAANATPWTVHFDDFQVFLPAAAEPRDTAEAARPSPSLATTRRPFQQSWDFSAGMLRDTRTGSVEVVDASLWKMPGGKHLRFLTGGQSWLEATFDVPDDTETPTRLTVRHLSSSPDGKQPGHSPVRISLNGNEIFGGSPTKSDWMEEQIDLGNYVQPGRNTLLWEYLDGAQTHYWLKSFRLTSGHP